MWITSSLRLPGPSEQHLRRFECFQSEGEGDQLEIEDFYIHFQGGAAGLGAAPAQRNESVNPKRPDESAWLQTKARLLNR